MLSLRAGDACSQDAVETARASIYQNKPQVLLDMADVAYGEEDDHKFVFNQELEVRHFLIEMAVYVPLVSLVAFVLWRRSLRQEVNLRLQAETRLQTLLDNTPGAVYRYLLRADGSEALLYISSGCRELWEVEPEVAMEDVNQLWQRVHPDDFPGVRAAVGSSARTLTPYNYEWRITTESGRQKWLRAAAKPQLQSNGDVVWDGLILDITERKQAEKSLEQKLQREQILNRVFQAIRNSLDLDTIFATATAETARLLPDLNCLVVQYFPERGIWKHVAEFRHDSESSNSIGLEIPDRGNPFAAQLKALKIVRVERTDRLKDSINQKLAETAPGAWLLVPLAIEGRIWGSFTLQGERQPLPWTDEQVELAQAVASQLEVAIQQAQLYGQVEEEKKKLLKSQKALVQAQEIARLGNWELDVATKAMVWSENLLGIFGFAPGGPEPDFADVMMNCVHPEDRPRLERALARTISEGTPYEIDLRIVRTDGSVGYIEARAEALRDEGGQIVKVFGTSLDISDRKQAEIALEESECRFRNMAANVPGAIFRYALHPDGSDAVSYMSPGCQDLWEVGAEAVVREARVLWEMVYPDDRGAMYASVLASARTLDPWFWQWRIITPSGQLKWLEAAGRPERQANGDVVWDTLVVDVSDRVRAELQLKHDAVHDGLTGLPNRSLLLERLEFALKRRKRHPDFQFVVLFLDLDNFKVINDSLGHTVGDELLLAVAKQLRAFIRETDLAARLGGDEFVILLEEIDEIAQGVRVAERILAALRSPLYLGGREVFVSASIGMVSGTASYHSAGEILRDADLAMYRAKQGGRGQYAIFDPAMHESAVQRLHLENDLRRALEKGELVLYYQPIVYLETEVICGFEALIRWQHPQRGLVPPGEFIEIAEETGLIVPMGQWILHAACQQLVAWQAQFPARPLRINVNLSVKQLQELLLQQLEEVLTTYNLQRDSLVLEITESMLVQNVETTRDLLNQVKARGILLSIDDFGTGYSCLNYLHQLPVDALKIDRAFVTNGESPDPRNQAIAESVIALSNLLELTAIAEGIETPRQLAWLRELGCELGQGFLFSPPLPAAQATELLKSRDL